MTGGSCMDDSARELKWQSYDRVGRVVHGVVIQFNSVNGVKLSWASCI